MINVSKQFREAMKQRRDFKEYITMSLADGTVLNLEPRHLSISNNSFTDSAGANTFPLGIALCKGIAFEIINDKDQYSEYDFFGAKIQAYLKFQLSKNLETISKGTYTVVTPETYGSAIQINAADDMYKADRDYYTSLPFPASAQAVLVDACAACQINLGSASFPHDDFVIKQKPKDVTFRQVIGYIAMIAGGNARIDVDNYLRIIPYDDAFFKEKTILDGGTFDTWSTGSYKTGDSADGGTFNPWNTGDIWDSGVFGDRDNIHILKSFKSLKVDTDDVVITGIRTTIKGDTSEGDEIVMSGFDGYVLEIENPLILGQEREFIDWIGEKLIGIKIRKFSGELISDPTIEFGDTAYVVDRNGNAYKTFITDCNFSLFGFTSISNSVENAIRNKSKYYSEATKAIVESRKITQQQITEYDLAVQQLTSLITQSFGIFKTEEVQEDGSIIYYMHNKPTLADSGTIWKMTAGALAVSTDGGKTWNAGIDASGNAVVNVLSAIGISADWIRTGALQIAKNGKTTFYADTDTGVVKIVADEFSLSSGDTIESIADDKAGAALTDAKEYSDSSVKNFVDAVYAPTISSLQAQIDGQIESWYYDYKPTLNNAPASLWATEEEKARHEGDLFYWKSKGYSYRFFKDGSTWKWQLISDSDITKALADAARAQDTADAKRRVFTVQPTPPYDAGDLWVQGKDGDIMTCVNARASGNYSASDWQKRNKYIDQAAADKAAIENLTQFMNEEYYPSLERLKEQSDKKSENYYQAVDPSEGWLYIQDSSGNNIFDSYGGKIEISNSSQVKKNHEGDLWYDTQSQKTYYWNRSKWELTKSDVPDELFDTIDGKSQVFVVQPTPPYDVGDLWVQGKGGDIMRCSVKRQSGNYVASDWGKASKYTDDSSLQDFVNAVYTPEISSLQAQIDGQIATWYYDYEPTLNNPPASSWNTEAEREQHQGDLFFWNSKGYSYRFLKDGNTWKWQIVTDSDITKALADAAKAQDTADAKRRVFVVRPMPPYDIGDLWFDSASSDIMTCINSRIGGSYAGYDWQKRNKYIDTVTAQEISNRELAQFMNEEYYPTIQKLKEQSDKKSETYYQAADPSEEWLYIQDSSENNIFDSNGGKIEISNSSQVKKEHEGDLWYNTQAQKTYYWNGSEWELTKSDVPDELFDTIGGKAQVFVEQPVPPYDVGDLWFNSSTSDIMTCITARASGNYSASDWQKRNKYIDQEAAQQAASSAVNAQTQEDIFNKLTNNGQAKGMWMKDNQLYFSFSYAQGGVLMLGGQYNSNGLLGILDESGTLIGRWGKDGIMATKGTFSGELQAATGTFYGSVTSTESGLYARITNARLEGGKSGEEASGYIDFNVASVSGVRGTRIGGKGMVSLLAPYIGVGDFAFHEPVYYVDIGRTASQKVITDIEDNGDGTITWHWKTITFTKGLMTTAL